MAKSSDLLPGERLIIDPKTGLPRVIGPGSGYQPKFIDPKALPESPGFEKPKGSFKKGGKVKKTAVYKLHKGEKVIPAKKASPKKTHPKLKMRARRPVPAARKPARRRR